MRKLSKLTLLLTALFTLSLATVPVYAIGARPQVTGTAAGTAAKQKRCTQREKVIETILGHIAGRGQKQVDLFGTIATRVENFATTNNKQPSDYQDLVSAVNTAHDNAVSAVAAVQTQSKNVNLSCDSTAGSGPKGIAASFKAQLKSEVTTLQAYRTTVKNLIGGVKSVADAKSSTGGSH